MKRFYVVLAALVVAIAATLGVYSVTRSAKLGASSTPTQSVTTSVTQTNHRLDVTQAALNRALAQRPPAASGGTVPFVPPHQVVVNVTGSPAATPYTAPAPTHFSDDGGGGGD